MTWRLCEEVTKVVEELHVKGQPLSSVVSQLEDIAGTLQGVAYDIEATRRSPVDPEAAQATAIVVSGRVPEPPDAIALGLLFEGTDVSHLGEGWQVAEFARAVAWLVMTNKRAMRILGELTPDAGQEKEWSFLDRAMARPESKTVAGAG